MTHGRSSGQESMLLSHYLVDFVERYLQVLVCTWGFLPDNLSTRFVEYRDSTLTNIHTHQTDPHEYTSRAILISKRPLMVNPP